MDSQRQMSVNYFVEIIHAQTMAYLQNFVKGYQNLIFKIIWRTYLRSILQSLLSFQLATLGLRRFKDAYLFCLILFDSNVIAIEVFHVV